MDRRVSEEVLIETLTAAYLKYPQWLRSGRQSKTSLAIDNEHNAYLFSSFSTHLPEREQSELFTARPGLVRGEALVHSSKLVTKAMIARSRSSARTA
jgi:hypothetical protein